MLHVRNNPGAGLRVLREHVRRDRLPLFKQGSFA